MRAPLLVAFTLLAGCRTVRPAWSVEKALDDTRRTTTEGDVIGGAGKHGGLVWLGIPYAAPPVGELRWRAPRPPKPRDAVLQATKFARACVQPDNALTINEPEHGGVFGDEDCLYLNVWAPPGAKQLPVMVWIHGGGNSLGSAASYDLSTLATKQNVVVVSVQYRLGPLGWFRHAALLGGDDAASGGNFGTLDLVRSLEWVKDNAAAFGGDPGRVTLFGESAGGTNTYSLLLSPKAKGLFHRAIAQSPFMSRATLADAEDEGGHPNSSTAVLLRLLQQRGAESADAARARLSAMKPEEVARLLRGLSAEDFVSLYPQGSPSIAGMLDFPALFPDGEVLPVEGWLESFAHEGGWNRVPVITGSNRDEMKLFLFFDNRYVWRLFGLIPRFRDEQRYQLTASLISRLWRAWSVDGVATAMRASGASEVWSYRFDWDDEVTVLGADLSKMIGAAHGIEISFVHGDFDGQVGQLVDKQHGPARDALSAKMMDHWGAFAREGHPGAEWTPYDDSSDQAPRYFTFDTPVDRLKMTAGVERPDVITEALLADATTTREEKCAGLQRLVKIGFVSAERAAKVSECVTEAKRGTQ